MKKTDTILQLKQELFENAKNMLYEEQSKQINKLIHNALKEYERLNVPYELFVGYYDYDGMNLDKQINNDGEDGEMIDDNFDFVDYLQCYYEDLDFLAMVQLQIRFEDGEHSDTQWVEYNGYELFYYIEETTNLYDGIRLLEKDFDERGKE